MKRILIMAIVACFMVSLANAQDFEALENAAKEPEKKQTAPANDCKDDPRLETEIVTIMDSNTPVNPPITITPETYLSLDGEIIKRLAGQMVICPNNPVLKSGKPMKKISMDFEPVWQTIITATAKNDMDSAEKYMNSVLVKPKYIKEILNLFTPIRLDEKKIEELYKRVGISYPEKSAAVVDFYNFMGGKPIDDAIIILSRNPVDLDEYKEKYNKDVYHLQEKDINIGFTDGTINTNRLKSLGIEVIRK